MKVRILTSKLCIILFTIIIVSAAFASSTHHEILKVKSGTIDLSKIDFDGGAVVDLKGEWEFYWEQLLTPQEVNKTKPTAYQDFSGWKKGKFENKNKVKDHGFATYHLKASLPTTLKEVELYITDCLTSCKLFVNGIEIAASGTVGKTREESKPGIVNSAYSFVPKSKDLDLTIQVSNFHYIARGQFINVALGNKVTIEKQKTATTIRDAMVIGAIIIMAFYHLGLYFFRKKSGEALLFAMYCLIVATRFIFVSKTKIMFNIFPFVSWEWIRTLEFMGFFLGISTFMLFLCKLFREDSRQIWGKLLFGLSVIFTLGAIILPARIHITYVGIYHIATFASIVYMLSLLVRAYRKKRDGSLIMIAGFLLLIIGVINDLLMARKIIVSIHLSHFSAFTFILFQSIFIAKRFSKAFSQAEKAQNANIILKELDNQKTSFFQNISHELRTPLTLILNPLEDEHKKLPDNENLSLAAKSSRRLLRLVNQLLDFQKISATGTELDISEVNLTSFINTTSDYFELTCQKKNIKFQVLTPNNNVKIMGNVDGLEKIVFNYLSNAVKFTNSGGSIFLKLEYSESEAKISVKDSGAGIELSDQQKLFKSFSQLEDYSENKNVGTGLGLALCKELAEKMNGKVGVESSLGTGSTFWVSFPSIANDVKLIDMLYVDDESSMLQLFERIVTNALPDLTVKFAESASEARSMLCQNKFKTVISDLNMPKENGVSLLSYIQKSFPETTRFAVTGQADKELLQQIINENVVENIFYKPLKDKEIISAIDQAIQKFNAKLESNDTYSPKALHILDDIDPDIEVVNDNYEDSDMSESSLILVVDDIQDMKTLICNILKRSNYRIMTAVDGTEALEKIQISKPDLIITDWMMPKMSGPELIKVLQQKQEYSSIPTILLTAKNDEESKILGEKLGATTFIGKPFNELELLSVTKNLLKLKETEKEVKELNKNIRENVLTRFLPPKLVDEIISGKLTFDDSHKVQTVTVLFTDLSAFTDKTAQLGPRKMAHILNSYLNEMSEVVYKHGGTIDKFIGDSIMVLFGAPAKLSEHDQIQTACACALKMQSKLDELNVKWKADENLELKMRISIHHGPSIVGLFGNERRMDYTAIGSVVNVASRIEKITPEGEIYISETVRDLLPEGQWEKAGAFELKGVHGQMMLYKILQDKAQDIEESKSEAA
jgi:signal transduction histidine kinase/class 3 adenylate cyclase